MVDGRALLASLKVAAGGTDPTLCLPVGNPVLALLRPVPVRRERIQAADVTALTEWRNRFPQSFLTEFQATESRTLAWLTGAVAGDDGKILFMADTLDRRTFGYLGLDAIDWERGTGEADAVVRGDAAPAGAMALGLTALLRWAQGALGLSRLRVRVLADNPALAFYVRVGFVEEHRVPLRREERGAGEVAWVEDATLAAPERSLVHLRWVPA
ncbi:MAG TPA: GNAT family N-acetyltransferase [Candidatus Polarisedimenticolaceae bacterium]|nr:GNAT family N-acetyltransferase [Candidatus Polarisedimenticolaceae bacterium]